MWGHNSISSKWKTWHQKMMIMFSYFLMWYDIILYILFSTANVIVYGEHRQVTQVQAEQLQRTQIETEPTHWPTHRHQGHYQCTRLLIKAGCCLGLAPPQGERWRPVSHCQGLSLCLPSVFSFYPDRIPKMYTYIYIYIYLQTLSTY